MTTEITIKETATEIQFKNPALSEATAAICNAGKAMLTTHLEIARIMGKVEDEKLYEDDGYNNATEYAMDVFGWKKAQARNYINIGHRFSANEDYAAYSLSQYQEMLALPEGQEKGLMESGAINPGMTTKEVREAVSIVKPAKAKTEKVLCWAMVNPECDVIEHATKTEMVNALLNGWDWCKEIKVDGTLYLVGICNGLPEMYVQVADPAEPEAVEEAPEA